MIRKLSIKCSLIILVIFANRCYLTTDITSKKAYNVSAESEIIVAFDFSHYPFTTLQYNSFRNELIGEGFTVFIITNGTEITEQLIGAIDVFVICAPRINFTENELSVVHNYMLNGGSIFLISDYTESSGFSSNEIAKLFGYEQRIGDALVDTDDYIKSKAHIYLNGENIKSNNITRNVNEVQIIGGGGIIKAYDHAKTIVETDNDSTTTWGYGGDPAIRVPIMSILQEGEGRLAYIIDTNFIHDYDQDNNGIDNFYESCNDILVINTVCWLANIESTYEPDGCETHDPVSSSPNYPPPTQSNPKLGTAILTITSVTIIIGSIIILIRMIRKKE
ncbi:MAG: hypothetical protein KAR08_08050 [Candidatus Heimdallarchaeota archaeon]|nr:hypothetical protein [Candidatus Heimdallarchaeota archaeon]